MKRIGDRIYDGACGSAGVVLFFEKGKPFSFGDANANDSVQGTPLFSQGMATQKIWYYQLEPGRNMGKTNSLNDEDLREFVELQTTFAVSAKSWLVDIADVDQATFDLSLKNPNKADEAPLREPQEILDEIAGLDEESAEILDAIAGMVCS